MKMQNKAVGEALMLHDSKNSTHERYEHDKSQQSPGFLRHVPVDDATTDLRIRNKKTIEVSFFKHMLGKDDVVYAMMDLSSHTRQYAHLNVAFAETRTGLDKIKADFPKLQHIVNDNATAADFIYNLDQFTRVTFQYVNLNAKVFTRLHPHGTGSFDSIPNCVDLPSFLQHKIHSLDDGCRKDRLWIFYQEERNARSKLGCTTRTVGSKYQTANRKKMMLW